MAHAREQIELALVAALKGLAQTGDNVFRDPADNIPPDKLPALSLTDAEEEIRRDTKGPAPKLRHDLTISVLIKAKEPTEQAAKANEIAALVETQFYATTEFDALDLIDRQIVGFVRAVDSGVDQPIMQAVVAVMFTYRTVQGQPETIVR